MPSPLHLSSHFRQPCIYAATAACEQPFQTAMYICRHRCIRAAISLHIFQPLPSLPPFFTSLPTSDVDKFTLSENE